MLIQGLILMCAGMGTVFSFLVVLIFAINFSSRAVRAFEAGLEAKKQEAQQNAAPAPAPAAPAASASSGSAEPLKAPLAGLVLRMPTKPGDSVAAGAPVLIMEAMKMELEIKAPRDCKVVSIDVKQGDQVSADQVLATIA